MSIFALTFSIMVLCFLVFMFVRRRKRMEKNKNVWAGLTIIDPYPQLDPRKLRKIRIEKGIRLTDAADLASLTDSRYSDIETGQKQPNVDIIECLAEAVCVNVEDITRELSPAAQRMQQWIQKQREQGGE